MERSECCLLLFWGVFLSPWTDGVSSISAVWALTVLCAVGLLFLILPSILVLLYASRVHHRVGLTSFSFAHLNANISI